MDEILNHFRYAAPYILSLKGMMWMTVATGFGILAGAIPGIGTTLMMSMVLPFTFSMPPALSLSILAAMWTGSQYGTSIPAILIATPASGSSVPTTIDGNALHLQGKGGKALGVSLICGFIGGMASVIVLMLVVIPLGEWALAFGPAEYFGVALFGLAAVSSMSEGNQAKTLISGLFGLALSTVGMDIFTGTTRFTFGISQLADGIPMVPVIIGLFALPAVAVRAERWVKDEGKIQGSSKVDLPTWKELWDLGPVTLQATVIGIVVGVMPGAGAAVASFVAYNEAKRISKHPELFGKGSLEGVCAPETANNAVVAGDIAPMLALGVPGSMPAAVMMSALLVNGVWPGPMLFEKQPEVVYGLFLALIVSNVLMVVLGVMFQPLALRAVNVPTPYLLAGIMVISVAGSYAYDGNLLSVYIAFIFGLIGYAMRKFDFSPPSAMLGLVLGSIVEISLRRGLALYDTFTVFLTRPGSLVLIAIAVATFLWPMLRKDKTPLTSDDD